MALRSHLNFECFLEKITVFISGKISNSSEEKKTNLNNEVRLSYFKLPVNPS
jgi:hypothetical protein